jgi:streptogramin lyase
VRVADERLAGDPARDERLREAAARLAGELDEAGLFAAAALAAMAGDAVVRDASSTSSAAPQDERSSIRPNDIELDFEVDEHGRVWMIREGDCHVIGRREAVCAEMRRFLGEVEGDSYK